MFSQLRRFVCCGVPDDVRACGAAVPVQSQARYEQKCDGQRFGPESQLPVEGLTNLHVTDAAVANTVDVVCESSAGTALPLAQPVTDATRESNNERVQAASAQRAEPKPSNGRGSSRSRHGEEIALFHPLSRLEERASPVRLALPSASSFVESHSPFVGSAFLSTSRASTQGANPAGAGGASAATGSQPQSVPRHLTSADMHISASLSEPLVISSSSPGSVPVVSPSPGHLGGGAGGVAAAAPLVTLMACSGSTGSTVVTAVTAVTSGDSGGRDGGSSGAVSVQPQPPSPVWRASAPGAAAAAPTSATAAVAPAAAAAAAAGPGGVGAGGKGGNGAGGSHRAPSSDRPSLTNPAVAARDRKMGPVRGSLSVERSGGSRLGRPELAVVGPAAAGAAAAAAAAAPAAADAAAVNCTPQSSQSTATAANTAAAAAAVAAAVPGPSAMPAAVPATAAATAGGAGATAGSRGAGSTRLSMLSDMTRRLVTMVQDVGTAVSQVALLPGSQSRAASNADGAATAAGAGAASGTGTGTAAAGTAGGAVGRAATGMPQARQKATAVDGGGGGCGGGAVTSAETTGTDREEAWEVVLRPIPSSAPQPQQEPLQTSKAQGTSRQLQPHPHPQQLQQHEQARAASCPRAQALQRPVTGAAPPPPPPPPRQQVRAPQQVSQQTRASAPPQPQPRVQILPQTVQQQQEQQQKHQHQQQQQQMLQPHNALQPTRPNAASIAKWVGPGAVSERPGADQGVTPVDAEAAAAAAAAGVSAATAAAAAAAAGTLNSAFTVSRGSLRAGSDSGSAAGAGGAARRAWDEHHVVPMPFAPHPYCSTSRTQKSAQKDVSQIAMMQMLHFGSMSGRVPLQHLATLNVANLSREIRALHWIGQGGGGAVFQGVWQGAPVAVKFMLAARPEHVDATALEAVVSVAVGHPNVVTTYSFDVTRLTEASFLPDGGAHAHRLSQHAAGGTGGGREGPPGSNEETSATALFNALMETDASLEPCYGYGGAFGGAHRSRQQQVPPPSTGDVHGTRHGGGGGGSRPASSYKMEALSTRVRRAQATAAITGGCPAGNTTPGSGDGAAEGCPSTSQNANVVAASAPGAPAEAGAVPCTTSPGHEDLQPERVVAGPAAAGGGGGDPRVGGTAPAVPPNQPRAGASNLVESLGIESMFNSEEGFGDPDLTDNSQSWTVRHVLAYLKARPGMYMTHIIMEYCDRGSLQSAIKRGIFKMDGLPDDDGLGSSSTGGGSGSGGIRAAAAAAAAAAPPPPQPQPSEGSPRITKRVVLRALLRTARDVAQGMCHLHANGIIHGDLKPGNVLLRGCRTDRRGFTALVSDFGLSKVTRGDKPLELNHWSTVTVMAPEVIMGRWLKASDVFSFGVLLWQLVTGEMMPYGNATVQQVLMGVAQGVLKPEWPSSAHPALVRLGKACLATSPEKRPSFEAIVKILIKIEQHVRNELRPARDSFAAVADAVDSSEMVGGSGAVQQINRLRSSAK